MQRPAAGERAGRTNVIPIACSPLTWGRVLFETVLDDAAGTGYQGVEANEAAMQAFMRQESRLADLLAERRLTLSAIPLAGCFFEKEEWPDELERLRRHADFLAGADSHGFVVFITVAHPARRDMMAGVPPLLPLTRDRFARLSDTLNRFGEVCRDFGLRGAVQNRVGTYLETPDEYQAVIEQTEPELVSLAPDIGHWVYAGGDPAALVRDNLARIAYPRLKDLDHAVLLRVIENREGFGTFVAEGGFTTLGKGSIPFAQVLAPLADTPYGGWVCVELERAAESPREVAQENREYLRTTLHW